MATVYSSTFTHPRIDIIDSTTSAIVATVAPAVVAGALAVSPDGNWLACASDSSTVQFMNTSTRTFGSVITTGLSAVAALVWAHDSSLVYCVGYHGVQTCTPTGTLGSVGVVSDYAGALQAVLSPDGSRIYVGAGTKVYELTTSLFAVTHTYTGLADSHGLGISPDGQTLYVSDYNTPSGHIYSIDVATGSMTTQGANNPGWLLVSPDGTELWCAENVPGLVQVFAPPSSGVPRSITVPRAFVLTFTPDASQVWVGVSDGTFTPVVVPISTTTYTTGTGVDFAGYFAQIISIASTPTPPIPPIPSGTAVAIIGPVTVTATGSPAVTGITGTATLNLGPVTITAADTINTRVGSLNMILGPVRVAVIGGRTGPGGFPVPGYRGGWRLTLHQRAFTPKTLVQTIIAELTDARARRLDQTWNTPATLTFTLDGHDPAAALIQELLHDVVAWRWDDQTGVEIPVFRGPICQSEDQITTESHTTTYICHDYAAMLSRRLLTGTGPYVVSGRDQDLIVSDLLAAAVTASTTSGTALTPASFLPVAMLSVNPDATFRGLSGALRARTYYGSQNIGTALDELARVVSGFDYDVVPSAVDDHDSLRIFYPQQGVTRTDVTLQYGSTVAALTRTVNSADYGNYIRVLGNNSSASPTPQFFSEAWEASAHAITPTPVGLWMSADDAPDVTIQSTLDDKAFGDLALQAVLVPSYTVQLTPGAYHWGQPNMGDTVPLLVNSGRLNVNTTVRVLGISYAIGDDGQEDITLTVSRPTVTGRRGIANLFLHADRQLEALTRR